MKRSKFNSENSRLRYVAGTGMPQINAKMQIKSRSKHKLNPGQNAKTGTTPGHRVSRVPRVKLPQDHLIQVQVSHKKYPHHTTMAPGVKLNRRERTTFDLRYQETPTEVFQQYVSPSTKVEKLTQSLAESSGTPTEMLLAQYLAQDPDDPESAMRKAGLLTKRKLCKWPYKVPLKNPPKPQYNYKLSEKQNKRALDAWKEKCRVLNEQRKLKRQFYTWREKFEEFQNSLTFQQCFHRALIDRIDAIQVSEDMVLGQFKRIAMLDKGRAFDPQGLVKNIHDMDLDVRQCISKIDTTPIFKKVTELNDSGKKVTYDKIVGRKSKVEFYNGLDALKELKNYLLKKMELAGILGASKAPGNATVINNFGTVDNLQSIQGDISSTQNTQNKLDLNNLDQLEKEEVDVLLRALGKVQTPVEIDMEQIEYQGPLGNDEFIQGALKENKERNTGTIQEEPEKEQNVTQINLDLTARESSGIGQTG